MQIEKSCPYPVAFVRCEHHMQLPVFRCILGIVASRQCRVRADVVGDEVSATTEPSLGWKTAGSFGSFLYLRGLRP